MPEVAKKIEQSQADILGEEAIAEEILIEHRMSPNEVLDQMVAT